MQPTQGIQSELSPSESLQWVGQPRQGIVLRLSDVLMIPFGLFWVSFSAFWFFRVVVTDESFLFVALGVQFLLIGVYLLVVRFMVDARERSRTFYALTSQRVIVVNGIWNRRVKSLHLKNLPVLTLLERSNGTGSITFGSASLPPEIMYGLPRWPGVSSEMGPRLELIPEVRKVYELIRKAQDAAHQA